MRIYKAKNYDDMSRKAANIISAQIIMKPNCVLGLATGSTPIGIYKQLVNWFQKGDLDFGEVRTVNLDEYQGLGPENVHSYYYYMYNNLFHHVNIRPGNVNIPNGCAPNALQECARYDQVIHNLGGIDLQLLGIGQNGHIAFNEPNIAFEKTTHLVALTESTIQANARLFSDISQVPKYAYTMGIKNIVQAKKVILVASGKEKAQIVKEAFFGPVTPSVPASILQMHNDVTLVCDEEALSLI